MNIYYLHYHVLISYVEEKYGVNMKMKLKLLCKHFIVNTLTLEIVIPLFHYWIISSSKIPVWHASYITVYHRGREEYWKTLNSETNTNIKHAYTNFVQIEFHTKFNVQKMCTSWRRTSYNIKNFFKKLQDISSTLNIITNLFELKQTHKLI